MNDHPSLELYAHLIPDIPRLLNNEMHTVFSMSFCGHKATTFLWADAQGEFFVTAKHALPNAAPGDKIGVSSAAGEYYLTISDIRFGDEGIDVAVFSTVESPGINVAVSAGTDSLFLGQRLLFLGFPHGLANTYNGREGRPTPLVRSAFFSGVIENSLGQQVLILDGFNNPGYSGGPIFARGERGIPSLVGVISGYRYESRAHSKVYRLEGDLTAEVPNTFVQANSGMIYAVGYANVLEVLSALRGRNQSATP